MEDRILTDNILTYTFRINLMAGKSTIFLSIYKRATKQHCEIAIATIIVTSGNIPFFSKT